MGIARKNQAALKICFLIKLAKISFLVNQVNQLEFLLVSFMGNE